MEHAFRYAESSVCALDGERRLQLATAELAGAVHPYFFEGRLKQSKLAANLLTAVHRIVGARYFTPPNSVSKAIQLADPVVTSGGGLLRFEGFSGCCSTYIRVDLLPGAYEGEVVGKGTTNVDFNEPMRAALARVREGEELAFAIGREEFRLRSDNTEIIERKVELPDRWVRGMLEVQSYQAGMSKRLEAPAVEALRFLRTLPRASTSRTPLWIARGRSGLFSTARAVDDAVRLTDSSRLRVLEMLLPQAQTLTLFEDDAHQANAWVLDFGVARLTLALSAEVWRGFSGEGQALWALMQAGTGAVGATLGRVRAQLHWQAALDSAALARDLAVGSDVVDHVLRILGASGLAGFDVHAGSYFHRVLPFDLAMAEDLHPRLADARELVQTGAVSMLRAEPFEADVKSGEAAHRVREVAGELRCTCPWFARHQGQRGPCKHVLAAAAIRHTRD